MKSLIVYFSHIGENIINGEIVTISKGHTEIVAEKIASFTGGDLYKLEPIEPYPMEYDACNARAKQESDTNQCSNIKSSPISLENYDVIYLGFPIWYRSFPTIISKFVREHDFSNKILKPFCTNDEGMFGTAEIELKVIAKGALIKSGLAIRGINVKTSDALIEEWVKQ